MCAFSNGVSFGTFRRSEDRVKGRCLMDSSQESLPRAFGDPGAGHLLAVRDLYRAVQTVEGASAPLDELRPLMRREAPTSRRGLCDILGTDDGDRLIGDASLVLRTYRAALYAGDQTIGGYRDAITDIRDGAENLVSAFTARRNAREGRWLGAEDGDPTASRFVEITLTAALAERWLTNHSGERPGWKVAGAKARIRQAVSAQIFETFWGPEERRTYSGLGEAVDRLDRDEWPVDRQMLAEAIAHAETVMAAGEDALPWLSAIADATATVPGRIARSAKSGQRASQSSLLPPPAVVLVWGCLELVHAWAPDLLGGYERDKGTGKLRWMVHCGDKCAASWIASLINSAEFRKEKHRTFKGTLQDVAAGFLHRATDIFMPRTWNRVDPERLAGLALPPIPDEDCPDDFPDDGPDEEDRADECGEAPSGAAPATRPSSER